MEPLPLVTTHLPLNFLQTITPYRLNHRISLLPPFLIWFAPFKLGFRILSHFPQSKFLAGYSILFSQSPLSPHLQRSVPTLHCTILLMPLVLPWGVIEFICFLTCSYILHVFMNSSEINSFSSTLLFFNITEPRHR